MAKIFIADTKDGKAFLRTLLEPNHELTVVTSMTDAAAALKEKTFDLIIIDLHFDESRMYDAMHLVKAIPKNANKPIICFGSQQQTRMPQTVNDALNFATKALGAWMFIDLHTYNQAKDPNDELSRVIERCLVGEARKVSQAERLDLHKQREEIHRLRLKIENEEWSAELDEKLIEIRHKLTGLLLQNCDLHLDSISQQEAIDKSRDLKDRVSESVTQGEDKATRKERKQTSDELHHAVTELEISEREEEAEEKREKQHTKKR
jgi:CheY-like chemotaxis protein